MIRKLNPANTWKFAVGIGFQTTVTVKSKNYHTAVKTACDVLDKRYFQKSKEDMIPVSWDLCLLEARYVVKIKSKPLVF